MAGDEIEQLNATVLQQMPNFAAHTLKNLHMRQLHHLLPLALVFLISISSCKKDEQLDPVIPNEEEVITTLIYTLTPEGGGETVVFSFSDPDGDGGSAPEIAADTLQANTTYTGTLQLLNETQNPADDITGEIAAEGESHQFFFENTIAGLQITYADSDASGNPIGLVTTVETSDATSGTLTITLRHELNKLAGGVADGNMANAGGETDIEVTFDVEVQ